MAFSATGLSTFLSCLQHATVFLTRVCTCAPITCVRTHMLIYKLTDGIEGGWGGVGEKSEKET